jgi:hypothetical protein
MDNIEPAANPADEGVVTLPEATGAPQQEANTPAVGESDDLDALTKEALGETVANPEFVEIEVDGRKYKVAPGDDQPLDPDIKLGVLRDADYRKKTMTLSEERKAVQQEREAYQARANLEGAALQRAQSLSIQDSQIAQLSQISIDDLRAQGYSDLDIRQAQAELQELVRQRDDLARQVDSDVHALRDVQSQATLQAKETARREAQLSNKALTPERLEGLEAFAVSMGIPEEDARSIIAPQVYSILHYADIGKKFAERQRNAANMKAAGAGNPMETLGGVRAGGKAPEQMEPGEMAKFLGYS